MDILPVRSPGDLQEAGRLFQEYAASLPIDLCFQNFSEELASLPGKYAPPRGEILLARDEEGNAIGCVAVRPLDGNACEMKRLYVTPAGRGRGLGKALMFAILAEAERMGYREMKLDTLDRLAEAVTLYRRNGFETIPPYHDEWVEGIMFLGKRISP